MLSRTPLAPISGTLSASVGPFTRSGLVVLTKGMLTPTRKKLHKHKKHK